MLPTVINKPVFLPDIVASIRKEFRFVEGPNTAKEHDIEAGPIPFFYGAFKNGIIQKLQLYRDGIIAEAAARTDYLDEVIDFTKEMFMSTCGLSFTESVPLSRVYTSRIEVKFKRDISPLFHHFASLNEELSLMLEKSGIDAPSTQVSGFIISADEAKSRSPIKPDRFVIERRSGHAFEDCLLSLIHI